MEQAVISNNILEPIDPLNISFSLQKCKQISNDKTQTPSSSGKINDNELALFQMINQSEKENSLMRDPQQFFRSINLEKSLKNPLQSKEKKIIIHDYYPSSRNQLTHLKKQQQTTQCMRRVFSLNKQSFSEYNNRINIVEDYQRQKFIRSIQFEEKSQKNLSRLRMVSSHPNHYPYQQRKKCFSIDKRKDNVTRFGQLFDIKRPYKMYLGSSNHFYSQPSENIDLKPYHSEIQRLNALINKVDSYIKSPGTPLSNRFPANSIKNNRNNQREYNNVYANNIRQTNFHKYKNYGVDRRVFDQYLQKNSKRR